jgi:hypothetical protein
MALTNALDPIGISGRTDVRVNAQQRHMHAMMAPGNKEEKALTSLVHGLDAYFDLLGERKRKKQMTPEQHDQLMASAVSITKIVLSLTDGPVGRLDAALLRDKLGEIAGLDLEAASVVPLHDQHPEPDGNEGDQTHTRSHIEPQKTKQDLALIAG